MDYSGYRNISFERAGKVLVVTLNRPEALNATDAVLHRELSRVFADIARDPEAHAIILTGRGRGFCAGGDLKWMSNITPEELDALFREARKIILDLLEVEQPIIAAVNGPATGLGATLALFCDIVIAADNARIGDTHVHAGVVAGDGGAVIWPWLVGAARAKEYLMTGELLSAAEAYRLGLVNHVTPAGELMDKAMAIATRLAAGPQRAIRGTKAAVNKVLRDAANLMLDTSLALERQCFATHDHKEAIDAFVEKRPPRFTGR